MDKQLITYFKNHPKYPTLNEGQRKFFDAVFAKHNIFLTSEGGMGKSYCIELLFDFLNSQGYLVGRCASTGIAALNIGGQTLHSWMGIGLGDEDFNSLVKKVLKNKKARARITHTDILIIDEISMISADLFEKVVKLLNHFRGKKKIQIIISGDVLQLPVVKKGFNQQIEFFFNSKIWDSCNFKICQLFEPVRQKNLGFIKELSDIRRGKVENLPIIKSCFNKILEGEIDPIVIFSTNKEIDTYNTMKYNSLQTEERVYYCLDKGNPKYKEFFDKNCPAPAILKLKIGCPVMVLKNLQDSDSVNGTIGKVVAFNPIGPIIEVDGRREIISSESWELKEQVLEGGKFKYKVIAERNQIPLRLAYSISVHKCQGQTLDRAVIDLSTAFECGQHYVALSRVKSPEGLCIKPFDFTKIKVNKDALDFCDKNGIN